MIKIAKIYIKLITSKINMKQIQKAILKKGTKFLILLRAPNAERFPGYWDFPGGKLEINEDPFAGIEREVFEETSLKIKALKVVERYEFDLDHAGRKTHCFSVYSTNCFRCY